jgi:CDP-paratose 2-epimerase
MTDDLAERRRMRERRPVVITGGAGFLGCNIAEALAAQGRSVVLVDNLSRPRVRENLAWLKQRHPQEISAEIADVRDGAAMAHIMAGAGAVIHLAAQVAVTTSVLDPRADFETNALGTINVLEAVRLHAPDAAVLFASTNKVYGKCVPEGGLVRGDARYMPASSEAGHGFAESTPLDFYSPYGCSKGTADQYVIDYGRTYGIRTTLFRMSCLYGPHQFGTEDQGWVAHFLIAALCGRKITIYGDGYQVRDVLYVTDAVRAYLLALENMEAAAGRAFNLGGGPGNTLSLRELLAQIESLTGAIADVEYADWRLGDQLWYVSDTRRIAQSLGWRAETPMRSGMRMLAQWLKPNYAPVLNAERA